MTIQKLYLKKFINITDSNSETRDIKTAKKWLDEGKEVKVYYSDKSEDNISTINRILPLEDSSTVTIIFPTEDTPFIIIGIDNNIREIFNPDFFNKDKDINKFISIEEAKVAVEKGERVCADNRNIRTYNISKFIGDDMFETYSGSIYRITH